MGDTVWPLRMAVKSWAPSAPGPWNSVTMRRLNQPSAEATENRGAAWRKSTQIRWSWKCRPSPCASWLQMQMHSPPHRASWALKPWPNWQRGTHSYCVKSSGSGASLLGSNRKLMEGLEEEVFPKQSARQWKSQFSVLALWCSGLAPPWWLSNNPAAQPHLMTSNYRCLWTRNNEDQKQGENTAWAPGGLALPQEKEGAALTGCKGCALCLLPPTTGLGWPVLKGQLVEWTLAATST